MSLKQFNGRYLASDDRILFRFNTIDQSEYIFWFTRRVTHFILMTAGQFIEKDYEKLKPSAENFISDIQQSDKQGAGFSQAYEPGIQYPLGGDAILVMDAKCTMTKMKEQDVFSLDFLLPGGANMNLKLPVPVMKALALLLEDLNVHAKWGNPGR